MGVKYANENLQQEEVQSDRNNPEKLKEEVLTGLLNLVEKVCELPFVAIHLKEEGKQWVSNRGCGLLGEGQELNHYFSAGKSGHEKFFVEDAFSEGASAVSPFRFFACLPVYSREGSLIGKILAGDFNARKLSPEQLFTLEVAGRQVELFHELHHQQIELQKNLLEGQNNLDKREAWLHKLSHEIKAPLQGILGLSDQLTQFPSPDLQKELLGTLRFSTECLLVLANDLPDWKKLKEGKLQLEQKDFSTEELLKKLCHSIKPMAVQKKVELQIVLQSGLPQVVGDPLRLSQVLWNIMNHAFDSTEKGWVRLELKPVMEADHIISLQFTVQYTGAWRAAGRKEDEFDDSVESSAEDPLLADGSNQPLSIPKKLLELMGSGIGIQHRPGHSSAISFCLSFRKAAGLFVPEKNKEESQVSYSAENPLNSKKVLLADDNRVNLLVTRKMLEKRGMLVDVAGSGKEAVQLAAGKKYDIILMDLQMPGMDGLTATRQIKALNNQNNKVPVIALTASVISFPEQELLNCGVNNCLMKPFKPEKLYNLMYKSLCSEEQSLPVNPLQEKVDSIVNGDAGFKKQLLQLYLKAFTEIMDDLQGGRLQDAVYLRSLRHKHKPCFKMLGLSALEASLEGLQQYLDAPEKDGQKVLEAQCLAIHGLGVQVLRDLEAVV